MGNINSRINAVVEFSGLSKTAFGKEINLTQSMVSKLCSGSATPSERTVADICRVFDINEAWLLHGDGEMINYESRKVAVSNIISSWNMNSNLEASLIELFTYAPDHMHEEISKQILAEIKKVKISTNQKTAPDEDPKP